ncbi:hypothetical protein [Clostridium estertheticum]|uniref:hypothetical protein n=1 Tax=Clostridium estertheticum TaxID=238834 RepID=UPI001C0AC719|nr:hypothetical protein [Clostridium estertheticum]MBU3186608.1 hypothetical protein [Clostridium estertheticum]
MKEKYTNATVFYENEGEKKSTFCTNRNLTKTLNLFKRCKWITNIEVVKYNLTK